MTGLIGHTKRAVENERRRCVAFSGDVASSAFCRAVVKNAAMRAILEAQAISAFVADPNRQEPKISSGAAEGSRATYSARQRRHSSGELRPDARHDQG